MAGGHPELSESNRRPLYEPRYPPSPTTNGLSRRAIPGARQQPANGHPPTVSGPWAVLCQCGSQPSARRFFGRSVACRRSGSPTSRRRESSGVTSGPWPGWSVTEGLSNARGRAPSRRSAQSQRARSVSRFVPRGFRGNSEPRSGRLRRPLVGRHPRRGRVAERRDGGAGAGRDQAVGHSAPPTADSRSRSTVG